MEEDNRIELQFSDHSGDELLASLTPDEIEGIRQRVLEGIAEEERGEYTEYVGRAGLKQLTNDIHARGRERLLSLKTGQD